MAILSSPLRDFDKLPVNLQTEVCTMPIASPIRRQKLQAKKVLSPPTNTSWLGMDLLYDAINNADDVKMIYE